VPSTAAAERSWAVYGGIHTKKRNRLKKGIAKKLVAVKSNLHLTFPQMFVKQSQRRCEGNIDYYIKNMRPCSLFSTYDFNDDDDDTPLYLMGISTNLLNAWNEAEIDRDGTESDFDEVDDPQLVDADQYSDDSESESDSSDEDQEESENDDLLIE
jgi:hypothetical protein